MSILRATLCLVAVFACLARAQTAPTVEKPLQRSSAQEKVPVDQLIQWLLDEDQQLRGIAFSEIIADVSANQKD